MMTEMGKRPRDTPGGRFLRSAHTGHEGQVSDRMTPETPGDEQPHSKAILSAAVEEYERSVSDLRRLIAGIEQGQFPSGRDASEVLRQLRVITRLAIQERDRLEERRKKESGGPAGYALDLGAARDEVGRRLARLRAAGDAGNIPGGVG